ncbi:hypothetical protein OJ252_3670 [Cryptosporidium canis]|uniref:Uncharacterized protein n=1 Tax=Cryptosporidium canis TaxID=195482 RepID=A0ABQ8P1N3_9CRYT|nr:hypothetical protein OJ252_3670 [Cryptosporidium canis]
MPVAMESIDFMEMPDLSKMSWAAVDPRMLSGPETQKPMKAIPNKISEFSSVLVIMTKYTMLRETNMAI